MIELSVLEKLNVPGKENRLANLKAVAKNAVFPERVDRYINNHIHTTYSFSPYSPTAAVYAAAAEGLCTAGIIDHDTMAGAHEFLAAADVLRMPVTVGMECRVSFADTPFAGRRLNNPDQTGIAYMTVQSVPHAYINEMTSFFAPFRAHRDDRNRRMIKRLNEILPEAALDYEADVLPLSMHDEGGAVTERHLLFALARKLMKHCGRGKAIADILCAGGVTLSEKQMNKLADTNNIFYDYDLLGILKSVFLAGIYIDATEECPKLAQMVGKSREIDAWLCYAYLGDVTDSVTGDKKAQKFEDDYLEELFACLKDNGVTAVTYMPTRNTKEQLTRLRALCEQYDMFQISGEDINSPGQSFVIRAMDDPAFRNLIDATWKLIEHEKEA
ncbi:MAG: PHP domain-containing protein [Lachnospiraceae bacterium]|nr:PHP domain-containing protein [Lachnospiraceae bacterium]